MNEKRTLIKKSFFHPQVKIRNGIKKIKPMIPFLSPGYKRVPLRQLHALDLPTRLWPADGILSLVCDTRRKIILRSEMKDGLQDKEKGRTCCLKPICSFLDFLVKLDKTERGNTKAARPASTNPSIIELTPIDFPGLKTTNTKVNVRNNYHKFPRFPRRS